MIPADFPTQYLADHPSAIPTLAQWHFQQWSYLHENDSVERRVAELSGQLAKRKIPTCFVARDGEKILGSASLIVSDMDTRPELTPWLASVYVDAKERGRGIGTALVRRVVEEAKALGVETLYLFTPDRESFYARMGWTTIEKTIYHNEHVTIMKIEPQKVKSDPAASG